MTLVLVFMFSDPGTGGKVRVKGHDVGVGRRGSKTIHLSWVISKINLRRSGHPTWKHTPILTAKNFTFDHMNFKALIDNSLQIFSLYHTLPGEIYI